MSKNLKKTLYLKAIEKWGDELQLNLLEEECLELALAVRHYQRRRTDSPANLIEEMADVEIMLEQAKILLLIGTDKYAFRTAKRKKLKRLKERLEKKDPFDPSQYEYKPTPEELKNLERIMLEEEE